MPASKPLQVACPSCGKKIPWSTENRWRPFCSERCRMIDLGEWLSENMRIAGDAAAPEDDEEPPER
ncbi:MAG: DNA gyrase inhibitor YacG [Gammaproteobacteria bacterium]|nr:DNA gyrase inhibitor YacG [Gammaproteobacteria bacterium]